MESRNGLVAGITFTMKTTGLLSGPLFTMFAMERSGDLAAGVAFTFQNFTFGIFDIFTM